MRSLYNKIISLDESKSSEDETVVLCHGHFNFLHPGHIRYLENASQQGDKLAVSILGDSVLRKDGMKQFFSEKERAAGLAAIESVNQVILLGEMQLKDAVKRLKPNLLVLGKEFEHELYEQIREAVELIKEQGGKTLFHAGETHYASTEFFTDSPSDIKNHKMRLFSEACKKQGFSYESLKVSMDNYNKASILVVGDTIVDQYVACDALGMSAEAPIIVARELETMKYVGGAAIVALHAKALGSNCRFLSVVGRDQNANFVSKRLKQLKVEHVLIEDISRPTTLKIRYMIDKQKMFRVSRLKDHSIPKAVEEKLIREIRRQATEVQGIIVSDFVYGVVSQKVLEVICEMVSLHGLMVFGDLQCSSQVGNVSRFKNFDLICPTEREARITIGTQDEGVEWVANSLIEKTGSSNLIMKLGSQGFIAYGKEKDGFIRRQHFPALISNPIDVSGAGDSLLAAIAVGLSSNTSMMKASALGTIMAAQAVQTLGNVPVSRQMIQNYLDLMKANQI